MSEQICKHEHTRTVTANPSRPSFATLNGGDLHTPEPPRIYIQCDDCLARAEIQEASMHSNPEALRLPSAAFNLVQGLPYCDDHKPEHTDCPIAKGK